MPRHPALPEGVFELDNEVLVDRRILGRVQQFAIDVQPGVVPGPLEWLGSGGASSSRGAAGLTLHMLSLRLCIDRQDRLEHRHSQHPDLGGRHTLQGPLAGALLVSWGAGQPSRGNAQLIKLSLDQGNVGIVLRSSLMEGGISTNQGVDMLAATASIPDTVTAPALPCLQDVESPSERIDDGFVGCAHCLETPRSEQPQAI